ncbi:hypothetical protein VTN96DRAFT_6752 [Rasamsonia emersonii]
MEGSSSFQPQLRLPETFLLAVFVFCVRGTGTQIVVERSRSIHDKWQSNDRQIFFFRSLKDKHSTEKAVGCRQDDEDEKEGEKKKPPRFLAETSRRVTRATQRQRHLMKSSLGGRDGAERRGSQEGGSRRRGEGGGKEEDGGEGEEEKRDGGEGEDAGWRWTVRRATGTLLGLGWPSERRAACPRLPSAHRPQRTGRTFTACPS